MKWWKSLSCRGFKRNGHAAVGVNGIIYSFGGRGGDNYSEKDPIDIDVLNTSTSESKLHWELILVKNNHLTPSNREGHTVVASKHLIYLWGGWFCNNKLHVFNTQTLEWEKCEVKGEVPANRYNHTATVVRNKMYVFGGWDKGTEHFSTSVACLDLSTLCWSSVSPKNDPPPCRICHSATVHGDRFILIFGGSEEKWTRCNSLIWFDVETNEWKFLKVTATIPQPRDFHGGFIHNGFMYIFGGRGDNGLLNDLFRYNLEGKMEWTKVTPEGPSPEPRCSFQSVVINDEVFFFGGTKDDFVGKICDETILLCAQSKQPF